MHRPRCYTKGRPNYVRTNPHVFCVGTHLTHIVIREPPSSSLWYDLLKRLLSNKVRATGLALPVPPDALTLSFLVIDVANATALRAVQWFLKV